MLGQKRRRRQRLLLLAMAVLPQLASLAAMAGMLWAVKIKDVISAPAVFGSQSGRLIVSFDVAPSERPKLKVGSIVHGTVVDATGERGQEFSAQVTQIRETSPVSKRFPWKVKALLVSGIAKKPEAHIEPDHPVTVTMWTRTRRALDVVLDRANFSGIAGSALPRNAGATISAS